MPASKNTRLIDLFQKSRSSQSNAVVEGVQALKHATRFKAKLLHVITCDIKQLNILLDKLAPDVKEDIFSEVIEVSLQTFSKLSPQPPRTNVIALAKRRMYTLADIDLVKPIVLLEDPRDLENIGAVIRVAAAADAGAVCITGSADIWHPAVLRGAAGLHYALPVLNVSIEQMFKLNRPVISLDPLGQDIVTSGIPHNTILVFGTERYGISPQLLSKSDSVVRIPMKQGVSSLNLATSVAATLYRR